MRNRACRIGGSTSVLPDVAVVHAGDDQDTCTLAKHRRCNAWSGIELLALEAPSDGDGHVPVGDGAGQLGKGSGVDDTRE